ncbi:MAG: hypothetical protein GTN78_05710, partial [Gemmatimonadales bacterium]|nr:hypothetical protein [Gemmatimonadales bacterium]
MTGRSGAEVQLFSNILLLCHGDARDRPAIERAAALAQANRARLTVVEVIEELPRTVWKGISVVRPRQLVDLV